MAEDYRMRIHPSSKRSRQVFEGNLYEADRGWYKVTASTAEGAAKLRDNELNPTASAPTFEVLAFEAARQVEHDEAATRRSLRGTVEEPVPQGARAPGGQATAPVRPLPDMGTKPAAKGKPGNQGSVAK